MIVRTHRASMTGFGPMPCCGRTPYEVDPDDHITGSGTVTCLGVIPLPPVYRPAPLAMAVLLAAVPHGSQFRSTR